MAHEIGQNDHMFSAGRVTPWHRLGTVLQDHPSIDEGLIAAKLNWQVQCEDLITRLGEKVTHRAVRRQDTNEILGVVGPQWTPLQNDRAFDVFRPLVDDGSLVLETAGSLKNGRRVWVLGRMKLDAADIVPGDTVRPYVLLSNAHDGSSGVRFGFTPIRVVCNNTLTAAHHSSASKLVKIIHSAHVERNVLDLSEMMNLAKATFEMTYEQYRMLVSRKVDAKTLKKYATTVFKAIEEDEPANPYMTAACEALGMTAPNMCSDAPNKAVARVLELFETGMGSQLPGVRGTMWAAYNAVNEYLLYHRGSDDQNRLNRAWFGDGRRTDQTAFELALRMAA